MAPSIQPLEYLNADDYEILWEKEGLGMSKTYMERTAWIKGHRKC